MTNTAVISPVSLLTQLVLSTARRSQLKSTDPGINIQSHVIIKKKLKYFPFNHTKIAKISNFCTTYPVYAQIERKRRRRMQRAMIREAKEALEDYK